jgi:hypothetical protein
MTYEFDLQRLRQLIGREPTIYPKDIHKFVEFLLHHKEQGIDSADIYRQIEPTRCRWMSWSSSARKSMTRRWLAAWRLASPVS